MIRYNYNMVRFLRPKRILLCLLLVAIQWLPALCKTDCVIIYVKNAPPTLIPFESVSDIRFVDKEMSVGSHSFLLQELERYSFADTASVISIEDGDEEIQIRLDPKGVVYFDENTDIRQVYVSNISGIRCRVKIAPGIVDFSEYPSGIYIVSIGDESLKVIKR